MVEQLEALRNKHPHTGRAASVAITHLETAVMWANKAATQIKTDQEQGVSVEEKA